MTTVVMSAIDRRRGSSLMVSGFRQPGEVKTAIAIVLQKKSCARPAWPIGYRRRQEQNDGQAAEQSLEDYRAEGRETKLAHPGSRVDPPDPHRENDREKADRARDQPMTVLVEDAADHFFQGEREHEGAVRIRRVRDREARTLLVTIPPAAIRSTVEQTTRSA